MDLSNLLSQPYKPVSIPTSCCDKSFTKSLCVARRILSLYLPPIPFTGISPTSSLVYERETGKTSLDPPSPPPGGRRRVKTAFWATSAHSPPGLFGVKTPSSRIPGQNEGAPPAPSFAPTCSAPYTVSPAGQVEALDARGTGEPLQSRCREALAYLAHARCPAPSASRKRATATSLPEVTPRAGGRGSLASPLRLSLVSGRGGAAAPRREGRAEGRSAARRSPGRRWARGGGLPVPSGPPPVSREG